MIVRLLNNSFLKICLAVFFVSGFSHTGKCIGITTNFAYSYYCSNDTIQFSVNNTTGKDPNGYTWSLTDFFGSTILETYSNQTSTFTLKGLPSTIADYDYFKIQVSVDSAGSPVEAESDITYNRWPSPQISLGPNKNLCPGTQVLLQDLIAVGPSSYSYEWYLTPGNVLSTNTTYLTSAAGKYYLKITDGVVNTAPDGCATKAAISIISFGKPSVTAISTSGKPVRCNGKELILDTRIDIESTRPYAYQWDLTVGLLPSEINKSNPTINTNSPNGQIFNVLVTDANNCTTTSSITIAVNPALSVNIFPTDMTLCKYNSAVLTTSASGGSVTGLGYTYSWLPVQGLSNPAIASPTVSPLEFDGITYTVTGMDPANCTATDIITIKKAKLALSFKNYVHDTISLCGGSVLGFNVSRKWGVPGYTFASSSVNTALTKVNDTTYTSAPVNVSSKFYVMVTDSNTCTDKDSLIVNIIPAPVPNIDSHDKTACIGGTVAVNFAPLSDGSFSYNWYNNSEIITTNVPIPDISNSAIPNPIFPAAKTESTRQYKFVVTDLTTQCTSTDLININTAPIPQFKITRLTKDNKVYINEPFVFNTTSTSSNLTFIWSLENDPTNIKLGPTAEYTFDSLGIYYLMLTGTSPLGCTNADTLKFPVRKHSSQTFYIPNVFAPASVDPKNNAFKIFDDSEEILPDNFSIKIYNVVGQEVFKSETYADMKASTDSKSAGGTGWTGDGYTAGSYTYYIQGLFADETPFTRKGGITLLK